MSNIDKKSVDDEPPVRLVNYTDVYYQDRITPALRLMAATASPDQISRFRVRAGDTVITKDSETPQDIAVPTYVAEAEPDMVSGYHLAIVRPRPGTEPRYLTWALRSDYVRGQFAVSANGMTRYGLTYDAIKSVRVPIPDEGTQRSIADFLDDQVARIDNIVAARRAQLDLVAESQRSSLDSLFDGPQRVLRTMLAQAPCYGVLVPKFVDDGVPFISVNDLNRLDDGHQLSMIDRQLSDEYRRTIVSAGDVLLSVVGSVDKCAIVDPERAGANVARAVARLRPLPSIPPTVLHGWLSTTAYLDQARLATGGDTAQPTLNMGDLSRFRVALPDDASSELAERITASRSHSAAATRLLRNSVRLLEDLKRSLITAAVTGEFDVSSADGSQVPIQVHR